jgi:hypothetical protein
MQQKVFDRVNINKENERSLFSHKISFCTLFYTKVASSHCIVCARRFKIIKYRFINKKKSIYFTTPLDCSMIIFYFRANMPIAFIGFWFIKREIYFYFYHLIFSANNFFLYFIIYILTHIPSTHKVITFVCEILRKIARKSMMMVMTISLSLNSVGNSDFCVCRNKKIFINT